MSVVGCGGDRDNTKRPIMGEIGARLSDLAIITSDNPRTEDPNSIINMILDGIQDRSNCLVEENRRKAIRMAMDLAQKDDIIVLCGKGHETYQILGTEKTHLDEREEVAAHLLEGM
jgi:UDP-N-acetylmuramoyl-L-alanyl-D-glutamate--2,6-diaminopimelate ligase